MMNNNDDYIFKRRGQNKGVGTSLYILTGPLVALFWCREDTWRVIALFSDHRHSSSLNKAWENLTVYDKGYWDLYQVMKHLLLHFKQVCGPKYRVQTDLQGPFRPIFTQNMRGKGILRGIEAYQEALQASE